MSGMSHDCPMDFCAFQKICSLGKSRGFPSWKSTQFDLNQECEAAKSAEAAALIHVVGAMADSLW